MTGKTHKLIGLMAGSAVAYYGVFVLKEPLYALVALSSPIGAVIPDVDHNSTKLGSSRKRIFDGAAMLFNIMIAVASAVFLILGYLQGSIVRSLITLLMVLIPFEALYLLSKINFIRDNLKFATKHRGIMHTLILPACIYASTYVVMEPAFLILLKGFLLGYITHLFADLLTVRGCPVFYPFSKKNIRFAKIKTGSVWEYVAAIIIICAIFAVIITVQIYGW